LRGPKELDSATYYIDRSIKVKRNYYPQNQLSLAESLYFKAELHDELGLLSEAENVYREVQAIYEEKFNDDNFMLGRLYSSMSTCFRDQFDFKNALEYAERSVQILRKDTLNNLNRLATAITIHANIYTLQEDYQASIPIYNGLLKLIENFSQLNRYRYFVYFNLATAYTNSHEFNQAKYYLDESYSIIKTYLPDNPNYEAYHYLLYGEYYLYSGKLKLARKFLYEADQIYQEQVQYETRYHSTCNELIGDLYVKQNKIDSALQFYQKALIVYLNNFEDDNIYSNPESQDDPDKREIFDILYKKAKAWKKYYDLRGDPGYLNKALSIYNLIDDLNDQARNSKLKDASLLILSDYYHGGYELAIDCAYELFRQTNDTIYLENAFHSPAGCVFHNRHLTYAGYHPAV
jgi:tetratricopeptide (TPR) repeat protein